MTLAIFDLDETILAGDSCSLFCQYLVHEGFAAPNLIHQDKRMMESYNRQTLVLNDYVRFLIEPLRCFSVIEINRLMPRFVDQYILPRLYPESLQLLTYYKKQGLRPLIISATAEFIVSAIAKKIGVDDILAIQLEIIDNHYTGEMIGVPTFQEGKVTRLNSWMTEQQETINGALFYSDSINDLPLLEQVDYPFATNPTLPLLSIAMKRNWQVLQWTCPEH
jgi:HAD superfamily hydrolase (TIGR01490 family)